MSPERKSLINEKKSHSNTPESIAKARKTRYLRKTNTKSKSEDLFYKRLLLYFNKEDIYRNYCLDSRYPYSCDFYIKSKDLFIEYQGHWTHGYEPFNENKEEHIKYLEKMQEKGIISLLLAAGLTLPAMAQEGYQPTPENLQARQTFQDNKFGIFLHYGIYSTMADGEWVMNNRSINYREYPHLADGFYPSKFNADEWVTAFKDAGARYITFTTRHHDGFSMFKTATSNYNIVDGTPDRKSVV